MASYEGISNILGFAVAFNPQTAFPLDARSMFGSYEAAAAAAATAENAGSSNTVYYYGQTLTVFADDVATNYCIQGDGTLKQIGATFVGDNKSVTISDETVSLKDFGVGYYAYTAPDTIIVNTDGEYTINNFPTSATDGAFVEIGETWYVYSSDNGWAAAGTAPVELGFYTYTEGWKEGLEPKVVVDGESYGLAWYEPSVGVVEDAVYNAIVTCQSDLSALTLRVGSAEVAITANATAVSAEETRATEAETAIGVLISANTADIATNTAAIATLNGTGTGSVSKTVADAIAEIVADAPEAFDTLKEISDWISTHTSDVTSMNTAISTNATDIAALETLIGTLPEDTADTVIGYVQYMIGIEAAARESLSESIDDALDTLSGGVVAAVAAGANNGEISVTTGTTATTVTVYTLPAATTSVRGGVSVDGTSITVTEAGLISVGSVAMANVTGLADALSAMETAISTAVGELATTVASTYVAKSDVVASANVSATSSAASDTAPISEKAVVAMLEWRTSM